MTAPADSITISSRLESIDDARVWVTERVRGAGLGDDPVSEIELALTEALANVIEHSYDGDPSKEIVVGVAIDGEALSVQVRDWGRAFDPGGYAARDLDDPGEGGYGVFLMEQLMDDVTREPQPDGGTLLTLVKRRKEGQSDG
jgi:serine/threonine-protein kinase RsbW